MDKLPRLQSLELLTGQRLTWRESGSGRPLILLHGWSMSSVVFTEVAEKLATDYRVLCPDLPGHGGSASLPWCDLPGISRAISEWANMIDAGGAALLGWSLGGQIAIQLAVEKQLTIEKLLLVATTPKFCISADWPHGLPVAQVRALERNMGRAYEKTLGDFFNLQFVGEQMPKERYRQILQFAVRNGSLPEPEMARAALNVLESADLRSYLKDIRLPIMVMHGALDQIIPDAAGQYLADQLSDAQFSCLSGVGHAPFFSCPELCVEQWRNFLG